MKEWLIKYKREGYDYTEIFECGLEKASAVWEYFRDKQGEIIYLEDIRIIQEIN